ncbi:imidazolonepropionase [Candidatus Micrarchaeota archaeon]|nr:imidazolonepropionase [Candidatus Micrarchaeota archaeon]
MITADLVIKNASELLTIKGASNKPKVKEQLSNLGIINNGAIAIAGESIVWLGGSNEIKDNIKIDKKTRIIDAKNKVVMPGFVDCHTHLVFAGSREKEWVDRINGKDYLEILKNGGGILSTVNATRNAGEEELLNRALHHLGNMLNHGTTTIEAKSGYGLTIDSEIKILRLLKKLAKKQPIEIVSTFLGAHAVPPEFANSAVYAKFIIEKMIPVVAKLADYCDVFCEKSAFSAEETKRILLAGKKYGLRPRAHINEFNEIGGTEIAKEVKAIAVDHLDVVSDDGIKNIREAGSITVLLPGVPFFLGTEKYAPAKKIIHAGIPIAIATDFNPGSCYCESMPFIISLACMKMKLSPAQAINAATINAAHAIESANNIGSIEVGKQADILILDVEQHTQIPYHLAANPVRIVIKKGRIVKRN